MLHSIRIILFCLIPSGLFVRNNSMGLTCYHDPVVSVSYPPPVCFSRSCEGQRLWGDDCFEVDTDDGCSRCICEYLNVNAKLIEHMERNCSSNTPLWQLLTSEKYQGDVSVVDVKWIGSHNSASNQLRFDSRNIWSRPSVVGSSRNWLCRAVNTMGRLSVLKKRAQIAARDQFYDVWYQLQIGVRYFDFDVDLDGEQIRTCHCLWGTFMTLPVNNEVTGNNAETKRHSSAISSDATGVEPKKRLKVVLEQIKAFLRINQREIVLINIGQGANQAKTAAAVVKELGEVFGDLLVPVDLEVWPYKIADLIDRDHRVLIIWSYEKYLIREKRDLRVNVKNGTSTTSTAAPTVQVNATAISSTTTKAMTTKRNFMHLEKEVLRGKPSSAMDIETVMQDQMKSMEIFRQSTFNVLHVYSRKSLRDGLTLLTGLEAYGADIVLRDDDLRRSLLFANHISRLVRKANVYLLNYVDQYTVQSAVGLAERMRDS
ncbi:hypothetical protein ACOME3_008102 [Neoechinorhynchus agilis]